MQFVVLSRVGHELAELARACRAIRVIDERFLIKGVLLL